MINIKKLVKSFHYAIEGIGFAFNKDQNIRIHVMAAILVILVAVFFNVNAFEMAMLGTMIVLVLTAEMMNTAMEKMVDLIKKEHSEEAKFAKDVSSGMVLVAAIGATIVGLLVFIPHFIELFKSIR